MAPVEINWVGSMRSSGRSEKASVCAPDILLCGGISKKPASAPRFSRTPAVAAGALPASPGEDTTRVLLDWGFGGAEVDALLGAGAVAQAGRTAPQAGRTAPRAL